MMNKIISFFLILCCSTIIHSADRAISGPPLTEVDTEFCKALTTILTGEELLATILTGEELLEADRTLDKLSDAESPLVKILLDPEKRQTMLIAAKQTAQKPPSTLPEYVGTAKLSALCLSTAATLFIIDTLNGSSVNDNIKTKNEIVSAGLKYSSISFLVASGLSFADLIVLGPTRRMQKRTEQNVASLQKLIATVDRVQSVFQK